jgi:hypothetical protein
MVNIQPSTDYRCFLFCRPATWTTTKFRNRATAEQEKKTSNRQLQDPQGTASLTWTAEGERQNPTISARRDRRRGIDFTGAPTDSAEHTARLQPGARGGSDEAGDPPEPANSGCGARRRERRSKWYKWQLLLCLAWSVESFWFFSNAKARRKRGDLFLTKAVARSIQLTSQAAPAERANEGLGLGLGLGTTQPLSVTRLQPVRDVAGVGVLT